jgi:tetratricopeptide (TPR) repeat protein
VSSSGATLPSAQAFDRAVTLHRRGRLREAEQLYRTILAHDPDHFGALHYLGVLAGQGGAPAEAERLIRRALARNAGSAEAHHNLGLALAGLGRLEEACAEYQTAVTLDAGYAEARNNLGNTLHTLGRSGEAIAHFEAALTLRPDLPDLHNNLGNALRAAGRARDAISSFRKALALRPAYAEAHNNLGVALSDLAQPLEAVAAYERAIELRPGYFEARSNLANALAAVKRYDDAVAQFETALSIEPRAAAAHNNYGNLLTALKRYADAIVRYDKAIEIRPDFAEAHNNLGNALAASGRPADAVAHFRRALEINPAYVEAHNNLGNVLGALERYDEAIACYRCALAIDPNLAGTLGSLGNALITVGRIDEGYRALEKAVALRPRQPEFYRSIAECKRFTADDPHFAALESLAQDIGSFTEDERIVLHFVLAKAYDDLGRHETAFEHLRHANALRRRQIDYDEATTLGIHDRVTKVFTPALMRSKAGHGDPSALPIFVVGMPRSGTTLIEQILASHPLVFGAGEILALPNAVYAAAGIDTPQFPETVPAMTAEQIRRIGEDYVSRVHGLAPSARHIVDKALGNFVFVGLIHLALPNARIIHACRDAVDTCLSCYSKLFTSELLYTYDFGELGRYYRSYAALMEHWRRVLPPGAMLDVQYEELVADFEPQARRIIDYCGLPFDQRCLSFHETQRPVRTASTAQVRRPIYRTSVGRWRPYEAMLRSLLDELEVPAASPAPRPSSAKSGARNSS